MNTLISVVVKTVLVALVFSLWPNGLLRTAAAYDVCGHIHGTHQIEAGCQASAGADSRTGGKRVRMAPASMRVASPVQARAARGEQLAEDRMEPHSLCARAGKQCPVR